MSDANLKSGELVDDSLPWKCVLVTAYLTFRQVMPLVLLQICESFNNSSIFAYVTFLVQDFGGANRDTAGRWAGIVASAVYLGAFCSSYFWGRLSDRFGKRPCLLAGSTGTLLCCLMFGFSFNLWWAIAARFMAGLLNGNLGVAKAYLGIITTRHNQARAFGLFALAFGAGSMLGSSIGGFTARPAVNWPHVFGPNDLFSQFPYLLPNLITALVVAAGLICAILFLPEPVPVIQQITEDKLDSEENSDFEAEEMISVWKQPQALLACGSYIQVGFGFILFEETMPLWLTSTIGVGGLNFSPPQIGIFLVQVGVWFILVQLFMYPYIPRYIGLMATHRLGVLLMIPVVLLTPLINWMAEDITKVWVGLVALGFGQAFADACAFSSVMVFINNSVDSRQLGEANGIGQAGVALVRAIGPAAGGPLFAWSVTDGKKFPFNHWFMFFLQAAFLLWLFCYSFFLSPTLAKPKVTDEEKQVESVGSKDEMSPLKVTEM